MWSRTVPSVVTAGLLSVVGALALSTPSVADGGHKIRILDDCDPASFNAVLGDGACIPPHGHGHDHTTFDAFISELQATQAAADWKFKPSMLTIRAGRPVILENRGGETHSFTMVKAFGGGFVPVLNQLSGNPEPAEECATTAPDGSLVPQPPSPVNVFVSADQQEAFATAGLTPGKYMFECCIHPWMRVVLTVR
jgi:plastocyanin